MVVSSFILSFLLVGQEAFIPKVSVHDSNVIKLLDQYDSHLLTEGFDNPYKQHFLLRVEGVGKKQIIYLDCASVISAFDNDVPDSYAEYKNRIVFIYSEERLASDEANRFQSFYNQFETSLGKDITRDRTQNPNFQYGFIHHPEIWRAEFIGDRLKEIKKIPRFPGHKFYNQYRYKYNDEGKMIYEDGVYHDSSIEPHQWEPNDFDLRKYLLQNTSVPWDSLKHSTVSSVLVVDERGKVIEATIEGMSDEKMVAELIKALKKMPPWSPGRIEGKPVKVRIRYGL